MYTFSHFKILVVQLSFYTVLYPMKHDKVILYGFKSRVLVLNNEHMLLAGYALATGVILVSLSCLERPELHIVHGAGDTSGYNKRMVWIDYIIPYIYFHK
uniref:Uncharacterized protein n=1 Tax=Proboscia inermis TaxID=420281 RepID=A0A7S0GI42_9STRA